MRANEKTAAYVSQMEAALDEAVRLDASLRQADVVQAMRYSLLGGGKRIRAQLVLGFCEGLGGDIRAALPAAVAVEMVHAYSLIHDDLPCMDDDDMRRGRPSCHIAFGESLALLAGDALLTRAFEVLSGADNIAIIGPQAVVSQLQVLAQAAGTDGMVGGQVTDVEPAVGGRSLADLEYTNQLKTGALIRAAARMGCIAAGADNRTQILASEYAGLIGLGFQVVDDILDVYGDADAMGKKVGRDQKQNKTTYLTLLGREEAQNSADELHQQALLKLNQLTLRDSFLHDLTEMLANRTR